MEPKKLNSLWILILFLFSYEAIKKINKANNGARIGLWFLQNTGNGIRKNINNKIITIQANLKLNSFLF